MSRQTNRVISYERYMTAKWIARIIMTDIPMTGSFFSCLRWSVGDLRGVLKNIAEEAGRADLHSDDPDEADVLDILKSAMRWPMNKLERCFDDVLDDYPCIVGIARRCIARACRAVAASAPTDSPGYTRIRRSFGKIFGAGRESGLLCEFIYFNQTVGLLENYFEDDLEIWAQERRGILARMLNIPLSSLQESVKYLTSFGLLNAERFFRLREVVQSLWRGMDSEQVSRFFCEPLSGRALPLESFRVPGEAVRYVEALLSKGGDEPQSAPPVHIMLYGPPGTGKTTFARSLAGSLGVKGWAVSSREGDDDGDRRASLVASLNLAKRHPGSFVLVDEAERLLDTSWQSKDKAWLNSFLEQPGRRMIWITNQIEHIDPAVRRRFSFSIRFDALSKEEQRDIWTQIITRHRVKKYFTADQIEAFAANYQMPAAVVEQAVSQAKELGYGKAGGGKGGKGEKKFTDAVELVLKAQATLRGDEEQPRPKPLIAEKDYTLSGVCLDGSVCRRARTRR